MLTKSKLSLVAVLLLVGLVWVGCSEDSSSSATGTVLSVSDNTADFGAFETFMIVDPPDESESDKPPADLTEGERLAIDNQIIIELEALGLTRVTEGADLLIASFVTLDTVDATATGYWYEYYWYGWYWQYYDYWYHDDDVQFDVGTLIIDAVAAYDPDDNEDDRLVFRGAAMGVVNEDASDRIDRLREGVTLIFGEWPESEE